MLASELLCYTSPSINPRQVCCCSRAVSVSMIIDSFSSYMHVQSSKARDFLYWWWTVGGGYKENPQKPLVVVFLSFFLQVVTNRIDAEINSWLMILNSFNTVGLKPAAWCLEMMANGIYILSSRIYWKNQSRTHLFFYVRVHNLDRNQHTDLSWSLAAGFSMSCTI